VPVLYSGLAPAYCSLFRLSLGRSVNRVHAYSVNVALLVARYIKPWIPLPTTPTSPVPSASLPRNVTHMAAVLAPSSVHSSSHLFVPHRDTFAAFHQHRGSAPASQSPRSPFDAFGPHHHNSAKSRSAAASWRHSEPQAVVRQAAPVRAPSPKYRRPGLSHSRTPSTSSEASSTSWRSHDRSPSATTRAEVTEGTSGERPTFLLFEISALN
jgi:hypothetical protein